MKVILVVKDSKLGAAIKQILQRQAYIVDWVVCGDRAWEYLQIKQINYKLAVFDWIVPGLSGLELCKRLRSQKNSTPVLLLSDKARLDDKIMGLDAGADDYLVKPFSIIEMLARLRALQRRSPQFQQRQIQVGSLTLDYSSHSVLHQLPSGDKQRISLTAKQFQLLEYLMKHPNQILTQKQIVDHLWEIGAEPVSNVVPAQIRLLRHKLGKNNNFLIESLYSVGYRLNITV